MRKGNIVFKNEVETMCDLNSYWRLFMKTVSSSGQSACLSIFALHHI
jgi:hypothetical protein